MEPFLVACVDHYRELAGPSWRIKKATTPFIDKGHAASVVALSDDPLYAARSARPDLLQACTHIALFFTKWTHECDKKLDRLMCFFGRHFPHMFADNIMVSYDTRYLCRREPTTESTANWFLC